MGGIERSFVVSGIVLGIIGMLLGIHMGISQQFDLAPVHAHINLVGWVSLLLFGLAYHTGIAKVDRWATVHFWIAVLAAVVFPIGIAIAILQQNPALAIFGSLLAVLSMILFLINVLRARA